MVSNYRVRAAIEEWRKIAREDEERQKLKCSIPSSIKTFQDNAKEMKDKIIPSKD